MENRRSVPRMPVSIEAMMMEGKRTHGAEITDLSVAGACIETDEGFREGTMLQLYIGPVEHALPEALSLPGMVMWSKPEGSRHRSGILFTEVDDRKLQLLSHMLYMLCPDGRE